MLRIRSLRIRLQVWYGLVMLLTIGSLSAYLYEQLRINMLARVDAPLLNAGEHFVHLLENYPRHEIDPNMPAWEFPPPRHEHEEHEHEEHEHKAHRHETTEEAERELPKQEPRKRGRRKPPPHEAGEPPHGHGPPPPPPHLRRPPLELPPSSHELDHPQDPKLTYFALWRSDGLQMAVQPANLDRKQPTTIPIPDFQYHTTATGSRQREVVMAGPFDTAILVGRSIDLDLAELRSLAWKIGGGAAGALLLSIVGGIWLSSRIFRPLDAISQTASRISGSNLKEQIPTAQLDQELQPLATVLNAMFTRLEAAFARQTQFTADASHELRTPLTVMQTNLELALAKDREPNEHQRFERNALSAAQRMRQLIEGLLLLARNDSGQMLELNERVDLRSLADETMALFANRAEELEVTLQLDADTDESAIVLGKEILLRRVLENLLENALRYTPPGGAITIALSVEATEVLLRVQDTGCGVSAEQLPHIFDRFYRGDSARSREAGGFGLGLAICQGIVRQHHGEIVASSPQGLGTTMSIRLPRIQAASTLLRQSSLPVA